MMPDVTEAEKPNGLPSAIAVSPILHAVGLGEICGREVLVGFHRHDREILRCVTADDRAVERLTVSGLHGHRVGAGDHVMGGQDEAALVVDDAAADAAVVLDLDHGRSDLLDDGLHRLGRVRSRAAA